MRHVCASWNQWIHDTPPEMKIDITKILNKDRIAVPVAARASTHMLGMDQGLGPRQSTLQVPR